MKLRTKLLVTMAGLAVVPVALVASILMHKVGSALEQVTDQAAEGFHGASQVAHDALVDGKMTDLTHVANSVYATCQAQEDILQQKVAYDLNVARDVLSKGGPVCFSEESVEWQAINQYTKGANRITLPKMKVGETWLGQTSDAATPAPFVDDVKDLVGGTCTVFQRMNDAGDMLRVCTNVQNTDSTRAIGTFIPAANPDGTLNPVVASLVNGQTFHGRAYVVNAWYITAYEPIHDNNRNVVGALYVGVPQQSAVSLRRAVMETTVGKTGYVYVLNATGHTRGHYVISKDGKRDGEDIWEATDADGKKFIQDICTGAVQLKPGEVQTFSYPWQNAGDSVARKKIVQVTYFAPWDWVIGVGAYEDEFYAAVNDIDKQAEQTLAAATDTRKAATTALLTWAGGIGVLSVLVAIGLSFLVVQRTTKPLNRIITHLTEGATQVTEASSQISTTSQQLAEGASEQASSLEETSSALEEMAAMTRNNANNAKQANDLSGQARDAAQAGDETMGRLNRAMSAINDSSGQISKVIKVIEEIAFQTNLLALNAAVEAARAGEHGKGFAVVAEEVRNLAQRSAEAARETTTLIEGSVHRAREGSEVAQEVGDALGGIVSDVGKISKLINGIAEASAEQAQGVEQVNVAISQMDQVTQSNAAGAEESASAAQELSSQAVAVNDVVRELTHLIGETAATSSSSPTPPPSGTDKHGAISPQPIQTGTTVDNTDLGSF